MPAEPSTRYSRTPYLVVHRQPTARQDVYGTIDHHVVLHAQLLRGPSPAPTCVVAMHPIGSPGYLPMFSGLARAGFDVVAAATRYSTGDAALIMENVLLDLAAVVRDTKERLGYERVVLAGWSGGGSLMAGYQAEATKPVISATGAGEPTALAGADLIAADGLMLIAAHRSRHRLLTDFLDPSVLDERNPERRDRELDLYDPANPNQPPYSPEFLDRYREAQVARNRRITAWAEGARAALKARGREHEERCFVVHGTMADPRWLDPSVDPNDRAPGSYLGDPRLVNNGPAGLARFSTTRSWLSQWGYDTAQVDAIDAAPRVTVPTLVVMNSRDDACPPGHATGFYEAVGTADKTLFVVEGANHYFSGPDQASRLHTAIGAVRQWWEDHQF